MAPIPLTETQMAELFRLRAENAALKEDVAQLTFENESFYSINEECKQIKETIAQQAEAIRLKDAALVIAEIGSCTCCTKSYETNYHAEDCKFRIFGEALLLQPSPEILQARDVQVAEACKAACENERLGEIIGDSDQAYENAITHCSQAIDSKEWRKYL